MAICCTIPNSNENEEGQIHIQIQDSTFLANTSRVLGVDGENTSLLVENSDFGFNASGYGGVLYINDGEATFDNCRFEGNTATGDGSVVYLSGGDSIVTLKNSVLEGNYTGSYTSGSIDAHGGTVVLMDSRIADDNAYGIVADNSLLWISGSRFYNSGISAEKSDVVINRSILYADYFSYESLMSLTSGTQAHLMNSQLSAQGEYYNGYDYWERDLLRLSESAAYLQSCTVADSTVSEDENSSLVTDHVALSSDDDDFTSSLDEWGYPLLYPVSSDFIDAGDSECPFAEDLVGRTRPQGAACDLGALEVQDDN